MVCVLTSLGCNKYVKGVQGCNNNVGPYEDN